MAYNCQSCNEDFEPDTECIIMPANRFGCFLATEWIYLCPDCSQEYELDIE